MYLIDDKLRQALANYIASVPSGSHPAATPYNLLQQLGQLPLAPRSESSTPPVKEEKAK